MRVRGVRERREKDRNSLGHRGEEKRRRREEK